MLFNMDKGNTRKRRHDVRRASQLLPLARSLYLSAISWNAQFKEALLTSSLPDGVGYSFGRLRSSLRNPHIFHRVRGTYQASSSRPSSWSVRMLHPIAISRSRQP
jgi:hypothetical protein